MQTDSTCGMCGQSLVEDQKPTTLFDVAVHRTCGTWYHRKRLLAALIDFVVAFVLLTWLLFRSDYAGGFESEGFGAHSSILSVIAFVLGRDACYGLSPGKALCGLQVVDADTDAPIGVRQSLQRNLILLMGFAIVVPLGFVRLLGFSLLKIAFQMRTGPRTGEGWANTRVIDRKFRDAPAFTAPDLDRIRRSSLAA